MKSTMQMYEESAQAQATTLVVKVSGETLKYINGGAETFETHESNSVGDEMERRISKFFNVEKGKLEICSKATEAQWRQGESSVYIFNFLS
jgi:hypothetical protein